MISSIGYNTYLVIHGPTTVTGSGSINLMPGSIIISDSSTDVLTNDVSHTIQGYGTLDTNLIAILNKGCIAANTPSQTLSFVPVTGRFTNWGTLQANGGGILQITNSFDDTGGTIQALDQSVVNLANGPTVVNGTYTTSGSGVVQVSDGNTAVLTGTVGIHGVVQSTNGSLLQLSGTFDNTGGTVRAMDNSVGQFLDGTILSSGTLSSVGSGYLQIPAAEFADTTVTMNGVTITGRLLLTDSFWDKATLLLGGTSHVASGGSLRSRTRAALADTIQTVTQAALGAVGLRPGRHDQRHGPSWQWRVADPQQRSYRW